MTMYLINSVLCSLFLFAFYKVMLEREKMFRFNRFYLLFTIVASVVIPLLPEAPLADRIPSVLPENVSAVMANPEKSNILSVALLSVYGLVALFMIIRFIRSLFILTLRAAQYPKVVYKDVNVVLVPENIAPHTFLQHIFISQKDYEEETIAREILDHELAHVRQQHSLDNLFAMSVSIVFWFNPVYFMYRKAIKLNHEFLADAVVLASCETQKYQHLLLNTICAGTPAELSSSLNYQLARKRLLMMTRRRNLWLESGKKVLLLPLLAITVVCCARKDGALEAYNHALQKIEQSPVTKYKDMSVTSYKRTDVKELEKRYNLLSKTQKAKVKRPAVIPVTANPEEAKQTGNMSVSNIRVSAENQ